jgi:ribonuclease HI
VTAASSSSPPHGADIVAYIDGGARGNPGPAGFGVHIERPDGTLVEEFCESIGVATNNVAEYRALIAALEWARRHQHRAVHVRSDSQLLVQQMLGAYRVKNPGLLPLHAEARRLQREIGHVTFEYVPRAQNADADRLANEAMDAAGSKVDKVAEVGKQGLRGGRVSTANAHTVKPKVAAAVRSDDPFTSTERDVRMFIYRHFLETTRAPSASTIAAAVNAREEVVASALRRLAELHAIVLAPASIEIWMAHPFSAVPTPYPVTIAGRTYWANCAWDAAGVMSLAGDGESRTRCADCGADIGFAVERGRVSGGGVVHFAVPPRRFWENVAFT